MRQVLVEMKFCLWVNANERDNGIPCYVLNITASQKLLTCWRREMMLRSEFPIMIVKHKLSNSPLGMISPLTHPSCTNLRKIIGLLETLKMNIKQCLPWLGKGLMSVIWANVYSQKPVEGWLCIFICKFIISKTPSIHNWCLLWLGAWFSNGFYTQLIPNRNILLSDD